MDREGLWLRTRAIVSSWFEVIVAVVLIVGLLGGAMSVGSALSPGTIQETTEVAVWSVEGSVSHRATVTQANPLYPNGTILRNQSVYFTTVSPTVQVNYTVGITHPGSVPVTVTVRPDLLLRSASEGTVYWSERIELAPAERVTLAAGEHATVSLSLNATAIDARLASITDALGGSPGETGAVLRFAVTANTTVNGTPSRLSYTATVPLTLGGNTVSVGSASPSGDSVTRTRVIERPKSSGGLRTLGGLLLALLAVGGLAGLVAGHRDGVFELDEREKERFEYRSQRREFDEWIVRASPPESLGDREMAAAASLADLVDFAIDSDVAAIEDPETEQVYAVTGDLVLRYDPPAEP